MSNRYQINLHHQQCRDPQIQATSSRPRKFRPITSTAFKTRHNQHKSNKSDSLATTARKTAKSKNKNGNPIVLPSKILAVDYDAGDANAVYVAEAAGTARRVALEVCKSPSLLPTNPLATSFKSPRKMKR